MGFVGLDDGVAVMDFRPSHAKIHGFEEVLLSWAFLQLCLYRFGLLRQLEGLTPEHIQELVTLDTKL